MITNAPRYVSNLTIHEDLKIPYVREVISERYAKHHQKIRNTLQPSTSPATGNWATKTTKADPAHGPNIR